MVDFPKQTFECAPKDPDEVKKYWHNWTAALNDGEVITAVEVVAGEGSVTFAGSDTVPTGNVQMVKLTGGVVDEPTRFTLRATIDGGDQIYEVGIIIKIKVK